MRKFFKYFSIFLVVFWMIIVFVLSAEPSQKSENTSGSFTKIIFSNNITDQRIKELSFIIRKSAHFTLYTLGGMCICICVILNYKKSNKGYLISFVIGSVYAITDEVHQLFVAGRSGELRDVIIDSTGILIGVMIIKCFKLIIYKFRRSD